MSEGTLRETQRWVKIPRARGDRRSQARSGHGNDGNAPPYLALVPGTRVTPRRGNDGNTFSIMWRSSSFLNGLGRTCMYFLNRRSRREQRREWACLHLLDVPAGLFIDLNELKLTDGVPRRILPSTNQNLRSLCFLLFNTYSDGANDPRKSTFTFTRLGPASEAGQGG